MANDENDVIIPVLREELHAETKSVVTGSVRVTKQVHSHNEVIAQELRKSHVEVKRVPTHRVVDGPQPVQRIGNTMIIPVVSEVLRVEREWVVTEEIHITEAVATEAVEHNVVVNEEEAIVERLDAAGNVLTSIPQTPIQPPPLPAQESPALDSMVARRDRPTSPHLSGPRSILAEHSNRK